MPSQTGKKRRCEFVSFSGIDGAGKSTQIENLRARLTETGLTVRILTFWDDVARLKNLREATGHKVFKGDKGVGAPEAPIHRRDKNVRSWPMTGVRLCLYLLDAMSLRARLAKELRSDADFLICDRYIYDELANLDLRRSAARFYVRQILKLVPKPAIGYLLDADPAQARARKPEYPLEFLHVNRAAYLTLGALAGMTVIPPMPVEDVKQAVLRHATSLFSADETVTI